MTKGKGLWTKNKGLTHHLLAALILCTPWIQCSPGGTETRRAQIDAKIDTTGVLKVGIRQNALPLGQRQDGQWMGYCADIAHALAEELSRDRTNPIQVLFITSTTQRRYSLVANGTVDIECGPNTINPETETTYGVSFSVPFFVTATQILTRPEVPASASAPIPLLSPEPVEGPKGPSLPVPLGVIKDTTNEADLSQIYPRSQIDNTFPDYEQGINAVLGSQISGFASDGILLVGTARRLNLLPDRDYILTTPKTTSGSPFCASYAMILPGGAENSRWRNTVNSFLANNREAKTIWRRWFSRLDPSIQVLSAACQ